MSPTSNRNAADGTLEHRDGTYILRYERHLRHPLDRVWAALTEPEQIGAWLAEADLDLVAGGAVELRWLNAEDDGDRYAAVARGHVTALDPPHLLELDTDVHGVLRWELREEADGTGLTFMVTVAIDRDAGALERRRLARAPRAPRGRARRPAGRLAALVARPLPALAGAARRVRRPLR